MRRTFLEFSSLADRLTGETYLYAFQFSDGVIKVGRSFKPRDRAIKLTRQLACRGIRIVRFVQVPTQKKSALTEIELIKRMGRIGAAAPGRIEWFHGVSWGAARTLLRQIAARSIAHRAAA